MKNGTWCCDEGNQADVGDDDVTIPPGIDSTITITTEETTEDTGSTTTPPWTLQPPVGDCPCGYIPDMETQGDNRIISHNTNNSLNRPWIVQILITTDSMKMIE